MPAVSPAATAASEHHAHIAGHDLRWRQHGSGPAVLLLHGSADSPAVWRPVAGALGSRWTCWMPWLPPLPTPRPGLAPAPALDHDIPFVTALLQHSGARVLVGHSYGGLLALRWALHHPGQAQEWLDRLVLVEPIAWGLLQHGAAADDPLASAIAQVGAAGQAAFARGDHAEAMRWLVDFWNGEGAFDALPGAAQAAMVAGAARTAAEVASAGADATNPAELAGLRVSTLVVAGTESPAPSREVARRLVAALPQAQQWLEPGAGHRAAVLGVRRAFAG